MTMMAFAPLTTRSATGSRTVSCGAFLKKFTQKQIKVPSQAQKIPGRGKGKVVSNKGGKTDGVAAQQFQIRLGKNTTVPLTLGFTKENELFVGRLAMVGFAAACIGEVVTGQGILSQLNVETGVPITDLDGIVVAIIGFNLLAGLLPASGKLVLPEEELKSSPKGVMQDPKISILQPKKFFGFSGFGFTKENELFVGRMAQLGFAAALIGEGLTGLGPLAQLGLETGIPLNEAEPLLLFTIAFTLLAAVNEGSGKFVKEE